MTLSRLLSPLLVLFAMLLSTLSVTPVQASSDSLLSALGIEANAQPKFLKVDDAFVLESEQQGKQLLLTLRIGDQRLLARITRYSFDQLGIHAGQAIWAQIKSVSLLAP